MCESLIGRYGYEILVTDKSGARWLPRRVRFTTYREAQAMAQNAALVFNTKTRVTDARHPDFRLYLSLVTKD